jgi:hypothetical protein
LCQKGERNEEKIHGVEGPERVLPDEEDTRSPQQLPENYLQNENVQKTPWQPSNCETDQYEAREERRDGGRGEGGELARQQVGFVGIAWNSISGLLTLIIHAKTILSSSPQYIVLPPLHSAARCISADIDNNNNR